MIKRITRKIWVSNILPLRFFASLARRTAAVGRKAGLHETKKMLIPTLVTPVKLRCDAPFRFLFSIKQRMATLAVLLVCLLQIQKAFSQTPPLGGEGATYCNPINIDYGYTPIPNFTESGRHRATADPVIVNYKGDYYLFSTNQWGYWWSNDMLHWNFNSRKFCLSNAGELRGVS
jgi:hypothetical protein